MSEIWLVPSKTSRYKGRNQNINKSMGEMCYNKSRLQIWIWAQNGQFSTQFGELKTFETRLRFGMTEPLFYCVLFCFLSYLYPPERSYWRISNLNNRPYFRIPYSEWALQLFSPLVYYGKHVFVCFFLVSVYLFHFQVAVQSVISVFNLVNPF